MLPGFTTKIRAVWARAVGESQFVVSWAPFGEPIASAAILPKVHGNHMAYTRALKGFLGRHAGVYVHTIMIRLGPLYTELQ